jgi:hypothetical protein
VRVGPHACREPGLDQAGLPRYVNAGVERVLLKTLLCVPCLNPRPEPRPDGPRPNATPPRRRVSSVLSSYFDAIEFSAGSLTGPDAPALPGPNGEPACNGPHGSHRGRGSFDVPLPQDPQPPQHHGHGGSSLYRSSRLPVVPSEREFPGGEEGPQPRCCAIS